MFVGVGVGDGVGGDIGAVVMGCVGLLLGSGALGRISKPSAKFSEDIILLMVS